MLPCYDVYFLYLLIKVYMFRTVLAQSLMEIGESTSMSVWNASESCDNMEVDICLDQVLCFDLMILCIDWLQLVYF